MTKVVINTQAGGFNLSVSAMDMLGLEPHEVTELSRHDARLVALVENFAAAACGSNTHLEIIEVPDGRPYMIVGNPEQCIFAGSGGWIHVVKDWQKSPYEVLAKMFPSEQYGTFTEEDALNAAEAPSRSGVLGGVPHCLIPNLTFDQLQSIAQNGETDGERLAAKRTLNKMYGTHYPYKIMRATLEEIACGNDGVSGHRAQTALDQIDV